MTEISKKQLLLNLLTETKLKRQKIKERMEELSQRRDSLSQTSNLFYENENFFLKNSSTKNFLNNCQHETNRELELIKNHKETLENKLQKKEKITENILNELNELEKIHRPQILEKYRSLCDGRLDVLSLINQISSALLEIFPNDEILDYNRKLSNSIIKNLSKICNLQQNSIFTNEELQKLYYSKFKISELLWETRKIDQFILDSEVIRRKTSDLLTEPFFIFE